MSLHCPLHHCSCRDVAAAAAGLPIDAVQLVESREAVSQLLSMDAYIDVRRPASVLHCTATTPTVVAVVVCSLSSLVAPTSSSA